MSRASSNLWPICRSQGRSCPGFAALANDEELRRHKITIEVGRVKNANKNPVAEKCIAWFGNELLCISPEGESVSAVNLVIATAHLNSRIRDRGSSAREMWYQRDQFINCQLPISGLNLIELQHSSRIHNHAASEKSKTPRAQPPTVPSIHVGDFVYITSDGFKCRARNVTWLPPSMVHGGTHRDYKRIEWASRDKSRDKLNKSNGGQI